MFRDSLRSRYCLVLLWTFWLLFVLRVLAQFIQFIHPQTWLPAFERWQGSALPYPVLLSAQLIIILLAAMVARRCSGGDISIRPQLGRALFWVGGLYFLLMASRLLLGLTLYPEHPWFGKPLPALFHLVLAGYILALGYCCRRRAQGGD